LNANIFRRWIAALATVFTAGFLLYGYRIAENGRFVQYDQQKDALVMQNSAQKSLPKVLDTRSGTTKDVEPD
jgi:hypothetical protein